MWKQTTLASKKVDYKFFYFIQLNKSVMEIVGCITFFQHVGPYIVHTKKVSVRYKEKNKINSFGWKVKLMVIEVLRLKPRNYI